MTEEQTTVLPSILTDKRASGEKLKDIITQIFTWNWIFSGWLEKLIVASALLWSGYSLERLLASWIGGLI